MQMPIQICNLNLRIPFHTLRTREFPFGLACHILSFDEEVRRSRVNRQFVVDVLDFEGEAEEGFVGLQEVGLVGLGEVVMMAQVGSMMMGGGKGYWEEVGF